MGAFTWLIKQGWLVRMAAKEDHARRPPLYFRHHPYFAQSRIPILALVWLFLRWWINERFVQQPAFWKA